MKQPEHYRGDEGSEGSLGDTMFVRRSKAAVRMISEKTSLSFKVIIPMCSFLILMTWRVNQAMNAMNARLESQWTISHQEEWTRQMKAQNPAINAPDARKIFDDINDRKQNHKPISLVKI